MGTFLGHALPGGIFLVLGFWWTIQITRRYVICASEGIRYYSSATFPVLTGKCIHWPIEPSIKIIMTTVGMVLELISSTEWGQAGKVVWMGDIQHVTMYSMFWLGGIVDILVYRGAIWVPLGAEYLATALAFAVEGILFSTHLHGRNLLDIHVHYVLLYVIAACALASLAEYAWHNNVLFAYARAFFVMFQGTWFFQVGFILYPPFPNMTMWHENSPDQVMLATSIFAWHIGGVFVAMLALSGVTSLCSTRVCPVRRNTSELKFIEAQRARVDFNWEQSVEHGGGREGFGYARLRTSEPDLVTEIVTGDIEETVID